jgi:prepilin-type N-terminal cleavage/methylation domain-containing protein
MNGWTRKRARQTGFTLVEVLTALAIGTFVVAGVMTSYIFAVKGFRGLSNYNEIQADGRRAQDWFARDLWAGMAIASCTSNQLVVVLPTTISADGQVTASNQVTHLYQDGSWYRIDGNTGQSTLLAENVAQLKFSLYDAAGNVASQANRAVSVQVEARLEKSVQGKNQTADFLSARLRMRNAS